VFSRPESARADSGLAEGAVAEADRPETTRRRGRAARAGAGGPRYPGWLALPAVTWYALFFLAPLTIMAATSFGEVVGFSDVAYTWSLDNYRYLWEDLVGDLGLYRDIFLETLKLSLVGTLATLVIGFPLAYYIARYARHKTLLLFLVVVPFWTSFLIRAYAWLILLDPEFPLFRVLGARGFMEDHQLLNTPNAVYIGVTYNYLPLMVLPLYAALERMDWSLVEAAQDLGDSAFRAFRRVTLPLALPGILAGSLLVFIPLTGEYIIPVILGGNTTFYAGNLIAQQFLEARDWPLGSAIAMVVIGSLTIVLLVYARALGRREQF
jgi:spermidine/putrescine transport system permease protein